jgi:hypothetical protein
VAAMSGPHSAPGWSAERQAQVLGLFRDHRRRLRFLASSRCPADGGLLGASCELPDGLWVWIAGSRMSPSASLDAFRSEYLDLFDETEWTGDVYEQASEYADEQLREWGGHLQWDPEVLRVQMPASDDEEVMIWDRHSDGPHSSVATHRAVTCGCRRHYMLAVLALVVASVRAATGLARPGTWVRPMSAPSLADFPNWRREPGEDVYSFADGRMAIDLHERR